LELGIKPQRHKEHKESLSFFVSFVSLWFFSLIRHAALARFLHEVGVFTLHTQIEVERFEEGWVWRS
jgi:hypothetical protein